MATRIRLTRMGRKKAPHYRIVVADSASPRDGRVVETLGYYKPVSHPARLVLDLDRADFWIGQGALPTETVRSLLSKARKGGTASIALGDGQGGAGSAKVKAAAPAPKVDTPATAEAPAVVEAGSGSDEAAASDDAGE